MTKRLLLPFQHGMDMIALEQAVRLAKGCCATLLPLSLIPMSEKSSKKGARLDLIQQSKDFLAVVKRKTQAYAVPFEPHEIFTCNAAQTISMLADEMECEGIVLFLGYQGGMLLSSDVIGKLVEEAPCKLYIMRLPVDERRTFLQEVRMRFVRWTLARKRLMPETQEAHTGDASRAVEA